ncbi:unnamed protein product [Cylindrotheca closterium]|uniref:Uncharacterized protein n=1 Tax=Cylindrotheca closterium TaxID=2856 RepID=A0AAD2FFY3_9STRA|nr:unnamed protein product [Cylindrotheca closterium]
MLYSVCHGTDAWPVMKGYKTTENGRQAYLDLVAHYQVEGQLNKRRDSAYRILNTTHYNGKKNFSFEKFAAQVLGAFEDLKNYGDGMSEHAKVTKFLSMIKEGPQGAGEEVKHRYKSLSCGRWWGDETPIADMAVVVIVVVVIVIVINMDVVGVADEVVVATTMVLYGPMMARPSSTTVDTHKTLGAVSLIVIAVLSSKPVNVLTVVFAELNTLREQNRDRQQNEEPAPTPAPAPSSGNVGSGVRRGRR